MIDFHARTLDEVDPDGIAAQVRTVLPSLPPVLGRVATIILKDPSKVANSTSAELARIANTSEASVVRTAQELGFPTYSKLRQALATVARARRSVGTATLTADVGLDDALSDVVAKLVDAEVRALQETASVVDLPAMQAAIDAITAARRVAIFGSGASGLVAADLQQKLSNIGLIATCPADPHLAITDAALLTPADVAVAVSDSGNTVDSADFVTTAGKAGATAVAITGQQHSVIARAADLVLIGAGQDSVFRPGALSSRISQLLLVDCLFVGIVQSTYTTTAEALELTREALQDRRQQQRADTSSGEANNPPPTGTHEPSA